MKKQITTKTKFISLLLIATWLMMIQNANAQSWNLTGNAGTNASTNFIGTTDNVAFKIRTKNLVRITVNSAGKVGIGTTAPVFKLDVKGGSINTDSLYRIGGMIIFKIDNNYNSFVGNTTNTVNSGGFNTFLGNSAGKSNSTGSNNTLLGAFSGFSNTTGIQNTAAGFDALYSNINGSANSAFGYRALRGNSSGTGNVAVGTNSLFLNFSGSSNVAVGVNALNSNGTGNYNTANGNEALVSNISGDGNTAVGFQSLALNSTGHSNVAIGIQALTINTVGSNMVAIGDSALYNQGVNASGYYQNTAIGSKALYTNTSGFHNTAVGFEVLRSNTTGSNNTALGFGALFYHESGNGNVAIGDNALANTISGSANVGIGTGALYGNVTGNNNTGIGPGANVLGSNISLSTAIGANAFVGKNNSMVLGDSTSILVGIGTAFPATRFHVKYNSSLGNPEILLEESENDFARLSFKNSSGINFWTIAGLNSATNANERMNFYNSTTGDVMSLTGDGKVGIGITTPSQKLTVFNGTTTGTYTTTGWVHSSDEKLKTNIRPLESSLDKILKLEGVSYNWKANPGYNNQIGFIAQQVEKVFPEVVVKDDEGNYGMAQQNLIAPIIEAIKEQQQQIELKDEALKSLQSIVGNLQNENTVLKSRLDKFESALSQCCINYEYKGSNNNASEIDLAKLEQNKPNPFSESTVIKFYIPQNAANAVIKVYTPEGSEIKSIPVSTKGFGQIEFSGSVLSAGTYSYILFVDGKVTGTKQMTLTK